MNETINFSSASLPAVAADAWRLCVAPMLDWTDAHCRALHRVLAPSARLYSEMLHAHAVIHGDRTRLLAHDGDGHPVALQLGGSEPEILAEAARIGAGWGYDEINLNVGCPSDRVQAGRFGACLMREPARVAACVAAMREQVSLPVTVKCRIGVDEQEDYSDLRAFIDQVAAAGCDTFVVHARKAWLKGLSPKENREVPPLCYPVVYRLRRERPDLRIVINGGIVDVDSALQHLKQVDGVMLGRAAWHDGYVLHRLDAALSGAPLQPRRTLVRRFLPYVQAQLAQGVALRHLLRALLGLYHGQPGGRAYRQRLSEGASRPGAGLEVIEQALAEVCRVDEGESE